MAIAVISRRHFEWTEVYVSAGARLLAGQNLYPSETPFRYPPFSAALAIPFVSMPVWLSNLTFHLLSFAVIIIITRSAWRLSGGSHLPRDDRAFRHEISIATLALLCAIRFSFNALSHGQSDLLITVLLFGGVFNLIQDRPILAGACWGLAAAFKGPPLLLVFYLLWRRYLGAALTMVVLFFAANLFPDLIFHAPPGKVWLGVWFDQFFLPLLRPDHAVGAWSAGLLDNQSLAGTAARWFTQSVRIEGSSLLFSPRRAAISPASLAAIVYGAYALLAIVSASVMWPPFRRLKTAPNEWAADLPVHSIHPYVWETSISLCLVLLASPMSSRAHFSTLLLPAMCLARAAVERRDLVACVCLFTATGFSISSFNLGLMPLLNGLTLYLGFVTCTAFFLLVGCWRMRQLAREIN